MVSAGEGEDLKLKFMPVLRAADFSCLFPLCPNTQTYPNLMSCSAASLLSLMVLES